MSSKLTNLVPILDGTNYQQWAAVMQSFLMSQGQWKCTKEGANAPTVSTITRTSDDGTTTSTTTGRDELASWNKDAEKALGNIRLHLHHTIGYQFNDVDKPATLWENLKNRYGGHGLTQAFIEFKGMMDTVIPNGVDPSPSLDKIMSHFTRLTNMKWDIPKKIVGMMLLAKAPPSMGVIIQVYSQVINDLEGTQAEERLDPESIVLAMRSSWETHRHPGMSWSNQQQANKLSTVRPAASQPPSFQQQRGVWSQGPRGRGRQGKRGRQKNVQQQLQQAVVQSQPEPTPQPGLSQPPPFQWVPSPTPPSYASGPTNMGYFAASMKTEHPLPPTPPTTSFYPHFNKALNLAKQLGVPPTIKMVKKLKMAQTKMAHKTRNPHPTKHVRKTLLPQGEPQGSSSKGKERARDDNEVSLGYSGDEHGVGGCDDEDMDEVDPLIDTGDNDHKVTNAAGLELSFRQVHSTLGRTAINNPPQLDINIAKLLYNKN